MKIKALDAEVGLLRARLTLLARRLRSETQNDTASWTRMLVLGAVDRLGGSATPSLLAKSERMSSAHVASVLRELERAGFIVRTDDPEDGRRVWISLSADGARTLADSRARREEWLQTAMQECLNADERATVIAASALLERIARS